MSFMVRLFVPFEFERQKIEDVILVKPKVFGDNRGFFMESYKKSEFFENGIKNVKSGKIIEIKRHL